MVNFNSLQFGNGIIKTITDYYYTEIKNKNEMYNNKKYLIVLQIIINKRLVHLHILVLVGACWSYIYYIVYCISAV